MDRGFVGGSRILRRDLGDDGDARPEIVQTDSRDVDVVDEDLAFGGFDDAEDTKR